MYFPSTDMSNAKLKISCCRFYNGMQCLSLECKVFGVELWLVYALITYLGKICYWNLQEICQALRILNGILVKELLVSMWYNYKSNQLS